MTPEYSRAAIAAMQMLIDRNVTETPIDPMPILLDYPGVRVMSFTRFANQANIEREDLVPLFVANQDAATFNLRTAIDNINYVVVYNARLPYEIICRGIARELGHIVLGHDGLHKPLQVRRSEALTFAHHLITPRPVIRIIQESKVPLTMNVLSDTLGCSDECVFDMQEIPGHACKVPAEMNRQVRAQFERGINEYLRFRQTTIYRDHSPMVDLGLYMDDYEE